MSDRISYDDGVTWSAGKVIDKGAAAYSEIAILKDGSLGDLYEPGHGEASFVRFVRFSLDALTDGTDRLNRPYAPAKKAGSESIYIIRGLGLFPRPRSTCSDSACPASTANRNG